MCAGKRLNLWNRYRRAGLMPRAALLKAAANLTATGVREALDASGWPRPVRAQARCAGAQRRQQAEWHARRTKRLAGGGDVARGADRAGTWRVRDRQRACSDQPQIERLLRMGLEHGVGRAANVGYGQVELVARWNRSIGRR